MQADVYLAKMAKKDEAAVALAKKRWKDVSASDREAAGRTAALGRWDKASEADKLAVGKKLAAARAAKRTVKKGKKSG